MYQNSVDLGPVGNAAMIYGVVQDVKAIVVPCRVPCKAAFRLYKYAQVEP